MIDVLVALLADTGQPALFPSPEPQLYPVLAGPFTLYPAPPPADGPCCAGCGYLRGHHEGAQEQCPGLKTKTFQVPVPIVETNWREILERDARARAATLAERTAVALPSVPAQPRVPARPPLNLSEVAHFRGQARGLGRKALAAGWGVSAWYWMAGDGIEGCAVRMARDMLRAMATWKRAPGLAGTMRGWHADVAYAWRQDVARVPMKVTHTTLEGLIM